MKIYFYKLLKKFLLLNWFSCILIPASKESKFSFVERVYLDSAIWRRRPESKPVQSGMVRQEKQRVSTCLCKKQKPSSYTCIFKTKIKIKIFLLFKGLNS